MPTVPPGACTSQGSPLGSHSTAMLPCQTSGCVCTPVAIDTEQGVLEGMLAMAVPERCREKRRINNIPVDCAVLAPTLRSRCSHSVSQQGRGLGGSSL